MGPWIHGSAAGAAARAAAGAVAGAAASAAVCTCFYYLSIGGSVHDKYIQQQQQQKRQL